MTKRIPSGQRHTGRQLTTVLLLILVFDGICSRATAGLELHGYQVVPHVQSDEMQYRRAADFDLGARVQLFVRNTGDEAIETGEDTAVEISGKSPSQWLESGAWTWHDFPSALEEAGINSPVRAGEITCWSFNTSGSAWLNGDDSCRFSIGERQWRLELSPPEVFLSAVTFTGPEDSIQPDNCIVYIQNDSDDPIKFSGMRLWTNRNADRDSWNSLRGGLWWRDFYPAGRTRTIPAGEKGRLEIRTGPLPPGYGIVELEFADTTGSPLPPVMAWLRVKKEAFDISGGWVNSSIRGRNSLTEELFLKTLRGMHLNTAHIGPVGGYTDNPDLYTRYPLKYFNKLDPIEAYDRDELLPRIHGVEFLGEPQYGGGTPVPPMKVWQELAPYMPSRLHTTVTHSEERIWRQYSGLSDYPHYDAYRVCAPAADAWARYDRWNGNRIRWAAPLETIGTMTRSLRDLNRPTPVAYWSQGAHNGWGQYGGRARTSPTPMELRVQACQALANRITSLYWFNLSLPSILKFPDLIQPITEVNREIRMLEQFYIHGDATFHQRLFNNGMPDWDLNVISTDNEALLFATDLTYKADTDRKQFEFASAREAELAFRLPYYLTDRITALKRIDAGGAYEVEWKLQDGMAVIRDSNIPAVGIYLACTDAKTLTDVEKKRLMLLKEEVSFGFSPGTEIRDLEQLRALMQDK